MRVTYTVKGVLAAPQAQAAAWGSTSGGGTPTLDSPSHGISSITDVAVGRLDFTLQRPMASGTSYVIAAGVGSTAPANSWSVRVSNETVPTASVVQLVVATLAVTVDPQLGYTFMVYGL